MPSLGPVSAALQEFDRVSLGDGAPYIAILGPMGSGKSYLLREIQSGLRKIYQDEGGADVHITIDLEHIPVGTPQEMYAAIATRLVSELRNERASIRFSSPSVHDAYDDFERMVERVLATIDGRLVLYLKNVDGVPRFFVRSLLVHFRSMLEQRDSVAGFRRLALVVSGALSVFALKREVDSAFSMFSKTIVLPVVEDLLRCELVKQQLGAAINHLPEDALGLIASETGGEPTFIQPIVDFARSMSHSAGSSSAPTMLTTKRLLHFIRRISGLSSPLVELRRLALQLSSQRDLLELAQRLTDQEAVTPAATSVDIDPYQLAGVVVVCNDLGRGVYRFRNGMVARYVSQFLGTHASQRSLVKRSQTARTTRSDPPPIILLIRRLDAIQSELKLRADAWQAHALLTEAWHLLAGDTHSRVDLVVRSGEGPMVWLNDATRAAIPMERRSPDGSYLAPAHIDEASFKAAVGAQRMRRAFFGSDGRRVAVAVPIERSNEMLTVVTTVSRLELQGGFSEAGLDRYLHLAREIGPALLTSCLSEVGRHFLRPARVDHGSSHMQPARRVSDSEGDGGGSVAHLFFSPRDGAILATPTGVQVFRGRVEHIDNLNDRCQKLGSVDPGVFQQEVRFVAEQLEMVLSKNLAPLLQELTHVVDEHDLLIISDGEGFRLPFELLWIKERATNVALRRGVARRLSDRSVSQSARGSLHQLVRRQLSRNEPLRALLVSAGEEKNGLSTESECIQIASYLQDFCDHHGVRHDIRALGYQQARVETIEAMLERERPWHLFHFAGHGLGHSGKPHDVCLVLPDRAGDRCSIGVARFKQWLDGAGLWLAYLSSCHGTDSPGGIWGGTFDGALAAGVPVVVGFRTAVSDSGARKLADEFYRVLLDVSTPSSPSKAMLVARAKAASEQSCADAWVSSVLVTQYQ